MWAVSPQVARLQTIVLYFSLQDGLSAFIHMYCGKVVKVGLLPGISRLNEHISEQKLGPVDRLSTLRQK